MKTNRHFLILIISALILTACSVDHVKVFPDDTISSQDMAVKPYNTVVIGNGFNAYITFSETEESIRIEGNANLLHLVISDIHNDVLTVKIKNNVNIKGSPTLNVYIETSDIEKFTAAADSQIHFLNAFTADKAQINVSADSYFTGELYVETLNLKAAADARVDLYGSANHMNANLSADVRLLDYDFNVDNLKLIMSADCAANLTIHDTIEIDAAADCVLNYKGNAVIVHQNLNADSRINKMD